MQLSQTDWVQFHEQLRSAVRLRVPIRWKAGIFSSRASVGDMDALQSARLPETLDVDETGPLARYHAARIVFSATRRMPMIIDALSVEGRVGMQLAGMIRSPFLYLIVLLAVAYLGLFGFADWVIPGLETFRSDLQLPMVIEAPQRDYASEFLKGVAISLALVAFVGILLFFTGGATAVALLLGGQRYRRSQLASSAVLVADALIVEGQQPQTALTLACTLVGADVRTRSLVFQEFDTFTPIGFRQEILYDHFQSIARARLAVLRVLYPTTIVTLFGGIIVIGYSMVIFSPIVDLIRDLSFPGRTF